MATIALPRPVPTPTQTSPSAIASPITPPHSLHAISASSSTSQPCPVSIPVPNKHIPACPTGPAKVEDPDTPPPSPKHTEVVQQTSLLFPPDEFVRVDSGLISVYEIDAAQVAKALNFAASQPLPEPSLVFPWFHGLHPLNNMQQTFFNGRRRAPRHIPTCLRGVSLIKADGNLHNACLKGAMSPDDLMQPGAALDFIDPDPIDGFSIRNFQIQPAKVAVTSDIVVYAENPHDARKVAWDIATAQQRWREKQPVEVGDLLDYNTFVCTSPFTEFEKNHGHLVAYDSSGAATGRILDFVLQERREMWHMTEASEISHNVYLGPTPESGTVEEKRYDVLIECTDLGRLNPSALRFVAEHPDQVIKPSTHDFPSAGSILPPTWSQAEANGILETCKWIFHIAHGTLPAMYATDSEIEEDTDMFETLEPPKPRKVLIHCADGYTESTMLAIAYFSYSTGKAIPDAWLSLHTSKHRNFFAYPSDVSLLSAIAPRLLAESPLGADKSLEDINGLIKNEPDWFTGLDGSFPSRILDYLYLGNLGHANNPDLLKELNIQQILSVGETASWREGDMEKWGSDNVCIIKGVQDNGIDPLTDEFVRCLEFIDRGRRRGTATLVHCRVGVSRSATICIAEVMRALHLSFPRAYCFVRARRLNVIIQPHLRFAYELLRWEESLQRHSNANVPIKREMEWGEIAREIALMNRPYAR
ncbi:Dual specificity protein phosphatase PPS1 [Cladobotryum mycophilum]|uniref:Dual specificity protein phosphatase PPS1 n=1 Tax=Cladobotryum mycophilum TaxID=491253 RepID=A0ABR0SAM0_9HYPO